MSLDARLRDAGQAAAAYVPSPDLLDRVTGSIAEQASHRGRVRRTAALIAAGVLALAVWLGVTGRGDAPPWWAVEVALDAVLLTVVFVLGPLLRRVGVAFVDGAVGGRAAPRSFRGVLDLAYRLVFLGFVAATVRVTPEPGWLRDGLSGQLQDASNRTATLLLLMGVLHAVTIAAVPVVGLVLGSIRRRGVRARLGAAALPSDPRAVAADRVAGRMVVVAVVLAGLGGLLAALVVTFLGLG